MKRNLIVRINAVEFERTRARLGYSVREMKELATACIYRYAEEFQQHSRQKTARILRHGKG